MSGHANEPNAKENSKSASRPPIPADFAVSRRPVDYERALEIQAELVRLRQDGLVGDVLWLLEHPSTITFGSSGGPEHLISAEERLADLGISVHSTRRGGDVTCHEPGQLVGYPIVDLGQSQEGRDIHRFFRELESALIDVLAQYGLSGRRVDGRTGVWIDADPERGLPERKIIAMGIHCRRWVTSHGFAFNVENDLAGFQHIVPCGIRDAGVTSLERELLSAHSGAGQAAAAGDASELAWATVCERVHAAISDSLGRPLQLVVGNEAESLVGRRISRSNEMTPRRGDPPRSSSAPSVGGTD